MRKTDVAIVGAGIVGLAFALAYSKRGRRVTLFERSDFAVGASIRNFGLLWPIGQRFGRAHDRAMRSREIWLEVIQRAGLWHSPCGSLHLAYADDELEVLAEYAQMAIREEPQRKLISSKQAAQLGPVREDNLKGALWSPTEINVDPRQAVRRIPAMLREQYDVAFHFGANVTAVSPNRISANDGDWTANEIVICSGADFETLFPREFASCGLIRCKLQMMRTAPQPNNWRLGASPCAGLTLTHYDCFSDCPSLHALKSRFRDQMPFLLEHGIHVLVSQTAFGEITIGDSHEYGQTFEPFDRENINCAILEHLKTFALIPDTAVAERWNGVYAKLPGRTEFVRQMAPGVLIVTGLGGAGMTMSFGLAEEIVSGEYYEESVSHQGKEKVLV